MVRSKVAVLKTTPAQVVQDYGRLMDMAGYSEEIRKEHETCLRINISWHVYYPACSTTPWQLDGVISKLVADGWDPRRLVTAQNKTVVVDCRVGAVNNKLQPVLDRFGVPIVYLNEPPTKWIKYQPKCPLLVLDKVYPKGIEVPEMLLGKNVIHLPTTKTHVFTGTTGAMKNAFGGLLNLNRHWTHSVIHETLVDLLRIQKEIHPGIFAVMDGTIAGDGPGPRAMRPHIKNYILASRDCVAIDAIAAKMMGFDPMELKYIRLAHEAGLGVGRPQEIEVVGEDISNVNYGFRKDENTFASWGQKLIYWGPLKPLENFLLRTPLVPWSFIASRAYHDGYWYPFIGRGRVAQVMKSEWGNLFRSY
ncbi:MAG TPA: DUF362 domain-containing protein [Candidatus Saccharimonadales bacterium]|nr:DUF362 domain-containing protein [Candidatus Saccharimonadales bacterium]